jgi:hypothetical protein
MNDRRLCRKAGVLRLALAAILAGSSALRAASYDLSSSYDLFAPSDRAAIVKGLRDLNQ